MKITGPVFAGLTFSLNQRILKHLALGLLGLVLLQPGILQAATFVYNVHLDGPSEIPVNASPGVGNGTVIYDDFFHTLQIQFTFSGLLGNTTASHIHAATASPFTGTAGVATTTPTFAGFPLGVTSGSYSNTLNLTLSTSWNGSYITANGGSTGTAETALALAMASGQAYLNVHSSFASGGEIRGFLTAVPEPSTLALLGLAGGCACLWRRRLQSR